MMSWDRLHKLWSINANVETTAVCRICEPIAFMSVFPYIYYMVKSFRVTDDQRLIAIYAGMVTSAFAFAEFSTGVFWGRLSDRIGRKPVLIFGLAGTAVSMLTLGFATSLPMAILARGLGGLLNGYARSSQASEVPGKCPAADVALHQEHWCLGDNRGRIDHGQRTSAYATLASS